MNLPTYEQLVQASLDALTTAADMLDHLETSDEVPFLSANLIQGAQVYATLAQAAATKAHTDYFRQSDEEFEAELSGCCAPPTQDTGKLLQFLKGAGPDNPGE